MNMIGQTLSSLPFAYNDVNYVKIENGIYDDIYATHINEEVKEPNQYVVPDAWDAETYLHAKFNGNLYCGNTDFGINNTTNIIVKRRKVGTYAWFPMFDIAVDNIDDFNFIIVDPYAASGVEYEYAVVPIVDGVEGTYSTATCKVEFDQLVIIDKDNTYATPFNIETSQTKNNTSSTILPINAKYPIYVANATNDYFTGNVAATFLQHPKDCGEDFGNPVLYRDEVLNFLNNRKVKFIKEPFGKCWIGVVGNTVSDEDGGHNYVHNISFDFTEVGNVESNEDMNKFGLLNIGEEWWWT